MVKDEKASSPLASPSLYVDITVCYADVVKEVKHFQEIAPLIQNCFSSPKGRRERKSCTRGGLFPIFLHHLHQNSNKYNNNQCLIVVKDVVKDVVKEIFLQLPSPSS